MTSVSELRTHTKLKAVWKFPLSDSVGKTLIAIPVGAQYLRLAVQNGAPTIWALCDPDAEKTTRTFQVYGTGWNEVPANAVYVGTFEAGPFVWHVFELLTDDEVSRG